MKENKDNATSVHVEALCHIQVSDFINVTPGVYMITNTAHNTDNGKTWVGVLRTIFTFYSVKICAKKPVFKYKYKLAAQLYIFITADRINKFLTYFLALLQANYAVFGSVKLRVWRPVRPGLDISLQG
ncbi:carbohydrate porin [Microcoleus sp. F10-C6]|uniref:carbohydrate porin n=1 Tax=unclassified Microcoleus TaxID=2642155 RepID=UPI002FD4E587